METAKTRQCLFSWGAVAEPGEEGGNRTSLCRARCWPERRQKMNLIDPGTRGFQRTVISSGACEAQHIWCLVPCWPWKWWSSCSVSACFPLYSALRTSPRAGGEGGCSLHPKLEYLFLWKLDCSCNLYKIALFKKKWWNWFGLITESFHYLGRDSVTWIPCAPFGISWGGGGGGRQKISKGAEIRKEGAEKGTKGRKKKNHHEKGKDLREEQPVQ